MRHLITYKLFESDEFDNFEPDLEADAREESIANDIMDMSLDIQDEGFTVENHGYDAWRITLNPNTFFMIKVFMKHRLGSSSFFIDDIKDFILRVYEYGKDNPCDIEFYAMFAANHLGTTKEKKSKLLIRDNGDMSVMFQLDNFLTDTRLYSVEIRVTPR